MPNISRIHMGFIWLVFLNPQNALPRQRSCTPFGTPHHQDHVPLVRRVDWTLQDPTRKDLMKKSMRLLSEVFFSVCHLRRIQAHGSTFPFHPDDTHQNCGAVVWRHWKTAFDQESVIWSLSFKWAVNRTRPFSVLRRATSPVPRHSGAVRYYAVTVTLYI